VSRLDCPTCPACGGDGDEAVEDEESRRCRYCGGSGVIRPRSTASLDDATREARMRQWTNGETANEPERPVFLGTTEAHVSTSGFVNFLGGGSDRVERAQADAWRAFPTAVLIDGSDDWFDPEHARPQVFCTKLGIDVLGWLHTGLSGITCSGVVLAPDAFDRLAERYRAAYGRGLTAGRLRVRRSP
jgi:hypothetical protein